MTTRDSEAIRGGSFLGPEGWRAAQRWAKGKNASPQFLANAPTYWTLCAQAGLRPEVLYTQSAKETAYGRFGGVLDESFRNWAGIKTAQGGGDYVPNAHERFPTHADGVRAHVNHMLAYVHGKNAAFIGEPHARAKVVQSTDWAGSITTIIEMGIRWASANSPAYGKSLLSLMQAMYDLARPAPTPSPIPTLEDPMVNDLYWMHVIYLQAPQNPATWTTDVRKSFNHHLWLLTSKQKNLEEIRQAYQGYAGL